MEKYSHGPFEVTGYRFTINNPEEEENIIMSAWKLWREQKVDDEIIEKEYPTLHAVYYNYKNPKNPPSKGYDMLIGFITKPGSVQEKKFTTLQIPAQDYRYKTVSGELIPNLVSEWKKINNMSAEELPRNYGYDLDMYNADCTEVTIAVSVAE